MNFTPFVVAEGDMTRWNRRPRVVCGKCGKTIAPGGPTSAGAVSYGTCEDCALAAYLAAEGTGP